MYPSGKSNSNADALSHNPVTQVANSVNYCQVVCASKVKESTQNSFTAPEHIEPTSQVEEPIDKSVS